MTINRASLPSEFLDLTSARMLVEPQPQFIFAQMWKMALAASAPSVSGAAGLMGGRGAQAGGAPVPSADSMRLILEDPIYGSAVSAVSEMGKRQGHVVKLNRPVFATTTHTEASRTIESGSQISTTPIDISNTQVALTLKRFGGPYDATNSRVAPYGLDRFDASRSMHSLVDLVGAHMANDFDRTINTFMVNLLALASTTVRPEGFSGVDDFTTADSGNLDYSTLARVERDLDEKNIPTFGNGRRVAVITSKQAQNLSDDPQFARYAEKHAPINPILSQSYYKSIGGLDLFKSETLAKTANSSSVAVHRGVAFGPGVLGSGVGDMPRVAFSTDDNYGEDAKLVWLLYGAFGLLDNRFATAIQST
jgi:hypothetical protein